MAKMQEKGRKKRKHSLHNCIYDLTGHLGKKV